MNLTNEQISNFLMFRMLDPLHISTLKTYFSNRYPIGNSVELQDYLKQYMEQVSGAKIGLALSGGIDSAILAKFMPKGSTAYTFQCCVPGVEVINEVPVAARYAKECGLNHKVVEIYWEDFEKYAPVLS